MQLRCGVSIIQNNIIQIVFKITSLIIMIKMKKSACDLYITYVWKKWILQKKIITNIFFQKLSLHLNYLHWKFIIYNLGYVRAVYPGTNLYNVTATEHIWKMCNSLHIWIHLTMQKILQRWKSFENWTSSSLHSMQNKKYNTTHART